MGAEAKLAELGIELPDRSQKGYLNLAVKVGDVIYTSGHTSEREGKLGEGVTVDQGREAARDAIIKVLASVRNVHGTLDGLRVVRLLGCISSAPDFINQHLVMNGASDLIHELFGKDGLGYHARSALGYAQLPTGAAVEIEGIFSVEK